MRTLFVPCRQNRRAYTVPRTPVQSPYGHPERRFALYIGRESSSPKKRASDWLYRDSLSGRGGHKKRWSVPEPLQLFRESLPLPCFPCASFLFKSGLYSPSIAVSASKAAPCLPSRWPFRHVPRCGVERSEYSERESLSWGPARGEVPFSY